MQSNLFPFRLFNTSSIFRQFFVFNLVVLFTVIYLILETPLLNSLLKKQLTSFSLSSYPKRNITLLLWRESRNSSSPIPKVAATRGIREDFTTFIFTCPNSGVNCRFTSNRNSLNISDAFVFQHFSFVNLIRLVFLIE